MLRIAAILSTHGLAGLTHEAKKMQRDRKGPLTVASILLTQLYFRGTLALK